jgi:type I restriction enzyme S subunit
MPEYLWWALLSEDVYRQATAITGSAQPTVPLRGIRKLHFPLPSLTEQQRVVMQLNEVRASATTLQQLQSEAAAELDALLPSVLDKAFRGEL